MKILNKYFKEINSRYHFGMPGEVQTQRVIKLLLGKIALQQILYLQPLLFHLGYSVFLCI